MKKPRTSEENIPHGTAKSDLFESLHDDIVISVLCKLSSTASSPSDFIAVRLTCKRLNKLGVHPIVLSKSCSKTLAVKAKNWCEEAHQFLKLCINAGNSEAYYILGMIRFYCLENRASGASLMAKAAKKSHALALYSLAVIQFNGSGGSKNDKDLRAGVALCARAASLGNNDALRELGHCFQDGYGTQKNVAQGRQLLVQAYVLELMSFQHVFEDSSFLHLSLSEFYKHLQFKLPANVVMPIHPANVFLAEWFGSKEIGAVGEGLKMCSYKGCGRPETRRNEFRRCSACGKVKYCSRGCQAHDWRVRHKMECAPIEEWIGQMIDINGADERIEYPTVENKEDEEDQI